jgi:hypothetical protein
MSAPSVAAIVLHIATQLGIGSRGSVLDAVATTVASEETPTFGSRSLDAALLLVYCAKESKCTERTRAGDGGAAHGPWQLHGPCGLGPTAAQPRCWLDIGAWSLRVCSHLPASERLAALASGSCEHGHVVSRTRYVLATQLALASP